MRSKIIMIVPAALLIASVPQIASAAPSLGGGALTAAAEELSLVENVHYYGYRGGYGGGYGRGYYGGGYGGYGRGYYGGGYGGYGRGYYGGGYGGYGRGYYGGYGRGYY